MISNSVRSGGDLGNENAFYQKAFARNIGLLTEADQERLRASSVAIAGMGGVGGLHLITLARTGIGNFNLADFDTYEVANINRQYGARYPDFGRKKLEVMAEESLRINPFLRISKFSDGINEGNIDAFLADVKVVLDGLDFFNFEARRLLFNRAREKGLYVITAGPMGYSSALLVFSPHEGMSFDEYFDICDSMSEKDKLLSFAIGLAPRATHIQYMDPSKVDLDSKAGPSLGAACQLCSALAATETIKILLGKGKIKAAPYYSQFDPYLQVYRRGYLLWGNKNPIQRLKRWYVRKYFLGRR